MAKKKKKELPFWEIPCNPITGFKKSNKNSSLSKKNYYQNKKKLEMFDHTIYA